MNQFLQLPSQSQGTSQPNSSQLIIKELASIQQENQRLSANLKELKEQISCLITSLTSAKQENQIFKTELRNGVYLQSLNLRLEKSEQKLNQFAEITENLFLKNHANNDPMDVKSQVPILNQNEKKKIIKCWLFKRSGHLVRKC